MPGWNGWYHCMSNTYGTWLPGDPRGFRTRKHREHVGGDYKNPPPKGKYHTRHEHAKQSLKRDVVVLSAEARQACVEAMVQAWLDVHKVEVLAASVSAMHIHVLARFGDVPSNPVDEVDGVKPTPSRGGLREKDPARYFVAIAKERSAKSLAEAGLVAPGGVWAKRGKIVPIRDRQHQLNAYRYILDHASEGAAVWCFKGSDKT
ncbi:MAG: hypothetical protein AAGI37_03160 [Planctomycetota bacterium]